MYLHFFIIHAQNSIIYIVIPANKSIFAWHRQKFQVKRSWNDEREQLRAESEALKRQALRLQTEQVGALLGAVGSQKSRWKRLETERFLNFFWV